MTKTLVCVLAAGFIGIGTADAGQGRGRGEGRGEDKGRAAEQGRGNARGDARGGQGAPAARGNVVFATRDVTAIRAHYGSRYKNLPPGLQKKLARGGSLPPGWEKKIEPLPAALERNLLVLPQGYKRGVMDGHAVIYDPITHAIMDIASLF